MSSEAVISRERLLAEAAKAKAEIAGLPPDQRKLLDMQMAQLARDIELGRKIDANARTSSQ